MSKVSIRFGASFLSLLITFFAFSPFAQAHTTLTTSTPSSGVILNALPNAVILNFGEPLEVINGAKVQQVSVVDSSGILLNSAALTVSETQIIQPISQKAHNGPVTVTYRVAAADTHVLESSFIFYLGSKSASSSAKNTSAASPSTAPSQNSTAHNHDASTKTQKAIYMSSTSLILIALVFGIWYYRNKFKRL
jgi:methionine-rich copper-binding protein CopC